MLPKRRLRTLLQLPTSLTGLRALLAAYLSEDVVDLGIQLDAHKTEMLVYSIHDAVLDLHPTA